MERFHQDRNQHVWQTTELADIPAVQRQAECFFPQYCASRHHSALAGQMPTEKHTQTPPTYLATDFAYAGQKLPLVPGRVHFLRQVSATGTVKILNHAWEVAAVAPQQGVLGHAGNHDVRGDADDLRRRF